MFIEFKCNTTPILAMFMLVTIPICIHCMYCLSHYGWLDCKYKRELFIQGFVGIFNSIASVLLMFYIILMPTPNANNFKTVLLPFIIIYGILTGFTVLSSYLFFDSGLYKADKQDCHAVYFNIIYVNQVLSVIPCYIITCYFIIAGCWSIINMVCSSPVNQRPAHTQTPAFINPQKVFTLEEEAELELLTDAELF